MSYEGGNPFMHELRNLAVPFGIIVTKRVLEYVYRKSINGASSKASNGKKKSRKQSGGTRGCMSCQNGGNPDPMDEEIKNIAMQLKEALLLQ